MSEKLNNVIDEKFTVKHQYKLFLGRIGLDERTMHPMQKKQLKQAFYGAWGQQLFQMRDDISKLPEEKGIAILNAQTKEVGNFFIVQNGGEN